jgi:hypothetical protein
VFSVSGGWEANGVLGEVLECVLGWEEEGREADGVGGPDHGLDVEGWPAVGGHAYELSGEVLVWFLRQDVFCGQAREREKGVCLPLLPRLVSVSTCPSNRHHSSMA